MNRKKLEMKLLDQKNPYGFPLNAPPLIFTVELARKLYFTLNSTDQQVPLPNIRPTSSKSAPCDQFKTRTVNDR